MNSIAIIPARYASTRLPGKPLLKLGDKTIIEHVYRRVSEAVTDVLVATDDERITQEVERFGGHVVLTSREHQSGTDRIAEALDIWGGEYDVVVNVQGDEPFISPQQIRELVSLFDNPAVQIGTTLLPLNEKNATLRDLDDPNQVKVIRAEDGKALYFSRSRVPCCRDLSGQELLKSNAYYRHLGMYAYRREVLSAITKLPPSPLESYERLEQLRWLEAGYTIHTLLTEKVTIGIDTPEDLLRAKEYLSHH